MDRDPLVNPEAGDVVDGRHEDALVRWEVKSVDDEWVCCRITVTRDDGSVSVDDDAGVLLSTWRDWNHTDVRVIATAAGPVLPPHDPLVNPEPGDVVRATTKQKPARFVFVVTSITDDRVWGTAVRLDDGFSVPFVQKLIAWCDWSNWTDVKVAS